MIRWQSAIKSIFIASLMIFLFTAFIFLYIYSVKISSAEEANLYLSEVSGQSANIIKNKISGDLQTITALATVFGNMNMYESETIIDSLKDETAKSSFKRMGVVNLQGIATTTDGYTLDFTDREFYTLAKQGIASVSDPLYDKADGMPIYVYASPIYIDSKISSVIFATNSTETYQNQISVEIFAGQGYSYIVKKNGYMILNSALAPKIELFTNMFDYIDLSNETTSEVAKNMLSNKTGVVNYELDGIQKYMGYSPVGINDWYILSIIPSYAVSQRTNYLILTTLIVCIFVVLIFAALLFYISHQNYKSHNALERIAFYDELTCLPNWHKFKIDATKILKQYENKKTFALVVFDIDKFKIVNDFFGHDIGNTTLVFLAHMLRELLSGCEICARISADHMAILFEYVNDENIIMKITNIHEEARNFHQGYTMNLSFGIYIINEFNISVDAMHDRANLARQKIKGNHEVFFLFYDNDMRTQIIQEKELENDMQKSLEDGEFEVYLQPKYSFQTSKIVGAEALVRWNHTKKGFIMPGEFIPLFEKNGFVEKIDMYVYECICKKLLEWRNNELPCICISTNFSRIHLNNPLFVTQLEEIIKKYSVSPSFIELELTESAVFDNIHILSEITQKLHEIGFTISIDDFGSGYSSLNLLKQLPVDVLKLDKEFLDEADFKNRGKIVVRDVIRMAKHLKMSVVAEGVETQKQVDFLRECECDIAQGYYFSKPIPIREFEKLLFNFKCPPSS